MKHSFSSFFRMMAIALWGGLLAGCLARGLPPASAGEALVALPDSVRITSDTRPDSLPARLSAEVTAWRGEILNLQGALIAPKAGTVTFSLSAADEAGKALLPATALYRQGWVLGDRPRRRYADALLPLSVGKPETLPADPLFPFWLQIRLPAATHAGETAHLLLTADTLSDRLSLPITVHLLPLTLPPLSESPFRLNLWQNPFAVARYHQVPLWSPEHFRLMRPYLEKLASIGQKAVTATIIDRPWNGQTFDPFPSMVIWKRDPSGHFSYDYRIFDRWVSFAFECGINQAIHCYTLIPWHNQFQYWDEAAGKMQTLTAKPGSSAFQAHWKPFLIDFQRHLEEKGWLEKTSLSMDERPEALMEHLFQLLDEVAPRLSVTSACNYQASLTDHIQDISIAIDHTPTISEGWLAKRKASGQATAFYVCTFPPFPNTFVRSAPAEAQWLGWYAAARNFDGLLRWAYNSWPKDPLKKTAFKGPGGGWPAGDTFLIYPSLTDESFQTVSVVSSVRLEKLIDGIEDWNKIRILRIRVAASQQLSEAEKAAFNRQLTEIVSTFVYNPKSNGQKEAKRVESAETQLNALIQSLPLPL